MISKLKLKILSGSFASATNLLIVVITYPVFFNRLGMDIFGIWVAFGVLLNLARISNLGAPRAVTKLIAEKVARDQRDDIIDYFSTLIMFSLILGFLFLSFITFHKNTILDIFKIASNVELAREILPYIGILFISSNLAQILQSTLEGIGRIDLSNLFEVFGRIIFAIVSITTVLLGKGLFGLVYGTFISHVIICILSYFTIKYYLKYFRFKFLGFKVNHLIVTLKIGYGLYSGSIFRIIGISLNKILLSRYAGIELLPVFEIALRSTMSLRNIIGRGVMAILPEMSRLNALNSDDHNISRIYHQSIKYIIFTGVPLYILMFTFSEPILRFWLKGTYISTIDNTFKIMLIGSFFNLLSTPIYYLLLSVNEIRLIFQGFLLTWSMDIGILFIVLFTLKRINPEIMAGCLAISWIVTFIYLTHRMKLKGILSQ